MAKRRPTKRGVEARPAERALRQSEDRYRSLTDDVIDGSVIGMFILDSDFRVVWVNQSLERYFGLRRDEVVGKDKRQLIRERIKDIFDDPGRFTLKVLATYDDNTYIEKFECHVLHDGEREERWLEHWSQPIASGPYAGGRIEHYLDITERKRAEEELRQSEERLSTTLRSIGDAVIATDAEGHVTFLNPAAQSLTGWKQQEAVRKPLGRVFKIVSEQTGKWVEDPVTKVTREGLVVGLANHTVLIARDGTKRPIDDTGAPIRDAQGNIIGVVLVFHDVSEQKWTAEELRRLTARLLEVQEEERRQVAYGIHDGLGQMLTAASMHLEAFVGHRQPIQRSEVEEEFEKARRCLGDAVVEMRRMVSELGPLLSEDVGLVEASRRLLADMAERANWETEFDGDVNGDRLDPMAETALYRIVQEALANAAKHADAAKVKVAFKRQNDTLALEVRDWGRGFDANGMPDRPERGRYVGLVGMRERAALIGGEFSIESSPDGTRVAVTVPVTSTATASIGKKKAEVAKMTEPKRGRESSRGEIAVLIADDHPMVREGLRSMLDAEDIEVIGEAANGAEAVERVQQLNPDVVLMDVRMPDMDGLAATEIVKQGRPETSVIVITSYESKDYLRRAIEVGAAGYLLKGMSRESLIEAIRLVRGGGSLIDARLLSELLKEMGVEGSRFQGAEGVLEALTPREQDVLQLLVRGLTNKEIASEMHYSVGTVKNVVQRVIGKLGVSDRTQAAVYAVRAGLNPPP